MTDIFKQFDTVRVRPGIPESDIPAGLLATILDVYTDPHLAYEIEVVDANGLTLYVGVVDPSWIELVEPYDHSA